jgi:transcriptional regulator with XRE-family HTH domain
MLIKNIERSELALAIRGLRKSLNLTQVDISKELGIRQSTIAQWERDTYKPPAHILLKLSELATESERQWWRDQASERVGFDLSHEEAATPATERKGSKATDPKLLADVLEAVEAAMNKTGGFFSTQIRAEILAKVYDRWQNTEARDLSFIDRLVNRTRGPSNRKVRT